MTGKPFRFSALTGKPVILNFFFSHCGSYCPAQASSLARLQTKLQANLGAERYAIVSVSLTPERDKLSDLRSFAHRFSPDTTNWHFVTGPPVATKSLMDETKAQAIVYNDTEFPDVDHTTDVYVLDGLGQLTGSFAGLPLDKRGVTETVLELAAASSH